APVAPIVLLAAVYGLRNLRVATRQWQWSPLSLKLLLAAQAAVFICAAAGWVTEPQAGWHHHKAALEEYLADQPGRHLVFVEYAPQHVPQEEWVYNSADLDEAEVVWAHSMSPEENAELVDYYRDRQVWRVAADLPRPLLA